MSMDPMKHAAEQMVRAVNGETPEKPHPDLLPRSWEEDLRGQEQGGSANHGLLGHTVQLARDLSFGVPFRESRSYRYLVTRLRWELKHGLGAHEQLSPTYFGIHLACVVIIEYLAREHGLRELERLAAQWLDRVLALECLTSVRDGDTVKPLGPGMRADHRSVTEGRRVEGAIVARQIGMNPSFTAGDATFWGPLLEAAQAVTRVGRFHRPEHRSLLNRKKEIEEWEKEWPKFYRSTHLLVPMHFLTWTSGDWLAWIPESRAGQDPPLMAGGMIGGEHVYLWPFEGEDPPESGWRAEAGVNWDDDNLWADWYRKGVPYVSGLMPLPLGSTETIIGAPGTETPTEPGDPGPEPGQPRPEPEKPSPGGGELVEGAIRELVAYLRDSRRERLVAAKNKVGAVLRRTE